MRGASCVCVSKLGPSVGTFRSHDPTNHTGGRDVSLTHTNVEYFWSRSATRVGRLFPLVAAICRTASDSTLPDTVPVQCICVAQAVCACPNWDHPSGHFAHMTQRTTPEVEMFRSLTPMSSTFGHVLLLESVDFSHSQLPSAAQRATPHCLTRYQSSVSAWRKLCVRVQTGTIRRDISLT